MLVADGITALANARGSFLAVGAKGRRRAGRSEALWITGLAFKTSPMVDMCRLNAALAELTVDQGCIALCPQVKDGCSYASHSSGTNHCVGPLRPRPKLSFRR